jgi:hypothetical protein
MNKLETAFVGRGYKVANVDYPSRQKPIQELAEIAMQRGIHQCGGASQRKIHFVTHSLGGIIVRYYLAHNELPNLGRVVMLAPPNKGSEVVDNLRDIPGYSEFNGPAGLQLGTDAASVPLMLGPVTYPVGIIAGTHTINPILSTYLPDPDDGKVSVNSTKVDGMADFIEIPVSHPFIMREGEVIAQVLAFIGSGAFVHDVP